MSLKWPTWPVFNADDRKAVLDVIDSNQLFAAERVANFEQQFAEYTSSSFAVAVGNATQGLHLALAALSVGQGDEVIVPNYSFISTASCVLMQNAVPVFVDCNQETLAPTAHQIRLKITSKTKAVIVTHLWGFPCDILPIKELCDKHNIYLVEDCSHAHGAKLNNLHVGNFGSIGVFSLHQRKNLPVGDGGICITSSSVIRDKIYRLRSFGDEELSYNYRMTEFAGALGSSRLKRLDYENHQRRQTASQIDFHISNIPWIDSLTALPSALPVYHAYIFLIDESISPYSIKGIVDRAREYMIPLKETWQPLHLHKHFNPSSLPPRGLPWNISSDHSINPQSYSEQEFLISDHLITRSILQLDIHPGTTSDHVKYLMNFLQSL